MNEPLMHQTSEQSAPTSFDSVDVLAFALPVGMALLALCTAYFAS